VGWVDGWVAEWVGCGMGGLWNGWVAEWVGCGMGGLQKLIIFLGRLILTRRVHLRRGLIKFLFQVKESL
jgi:hypothetical protein